MANGDETGYGKDYDPVFKDRNAIAAIKKIYLAQRYKSNWEKNFEGKPLAVVIRQFQRDIKNGLIELPKQLSPDVDIAVSIEANLEEAKTLSDNQYYARYLRQYDIPDIRYTNPGKDEVVEDEVDVGSIEDIYNREEIVQEQTDIAKELAPTLLNDRELKELLDKIDSDIRDIGDPIEEEMEVITKYLEKKDTPDEINFGEETGYLLRINKDGKLEGFDDQTGNVFNPKTLELLGNVYDGQPIQPIDDDVVEKVVEEVVEGDWWSSDWNVEGPNIILLDDKKYALFKDKDGSFSSAGSKIEFDDLLSKGYTPIRETNEIWTTFRDAEELTSRVKTIVDSPTTDDEEDAIAGQPGSQTLNQFNNIPDGAVLVESDEDRLYLMYTVPGAGTIYKGLPLRMFYEVRHNDLYKAGILTEDAPYEVNYFMTEDEIDDFIVAGNSAELQGNDPNTGLAPHPFLVFVDNLTTQAQIAPWLLDKESISLIAEAELEGRQVSAAEWAMTDWYKEHSEAEQNWLRKYYSDPSSAAALKNDYKIQVSGALEAAGVTGGFDSETGQEKAPPDALVSWVADKWVSGQWTEAYASEQLALFADPFRSGVRDTDFTGYVTSAGVEGLERTAEKEDRVRQLYNQWLGPVFGQLTNEEVSERAGRIRNDPDFEAALIEQLKNNRLGLFPQYTNSNLSYEDIVTPWRNLTTSVWGEAADETESWWQDMVATNDFTTGTATLRAKGLEQDNSQVTIEATQALQAALGDGSVYENLGANQ